ncbi:MAG TPA: tetratricopeptide repeat protein, partial [Vicinamibacteria bacterium]|nr:tetratricopeptide repeat protein [Vicinamibacteria bacterium]
MKTIARAVLVVVIVNAVVILAGTALAQSTVTAVGFVVDGDGNPIPDVQVVIDYRGHIPQKYRTKTDKKGRFIHLNVYEGPTKVTFKKDGYGEATVDFGFRDLGSTEKPPQFKLSKRQAPVEAPAGSGLGSGGGAVDAASLAAAVDRINAAGALVKEGKLDEAQKAYEAMAVEMPAVPLIPYNLGFIYKKKGDPAKAEASFRKAAELDSKFPEAYNALAVALLEGGRKDEALAVLEKGVAAVPEDGRLQYSLGAFYLNAGKVPEAKEAFTRAEGLEPRNPEVQYQLATIALNQNDTPGALSHLE